MRLPLEGLYNLFHINFLPGDCDAVNLTIIHEPSRYIMKYRPILINSKNDIRPKRRELQPLIYALCVAVIIAVSAPFHAANAQGDAPVRVLVHNVAKQEFADKVEGLGTLRANESVDLTSTVAELITEINFTDGQRVKAGDVLVRMDAAEERAELAAEQSALNEAKIQLDRLKPLANRGAASQSALDEQRRDYETAKARAEVIKSRIDRRVITAPFDGVLGLRDISVGALVQPGSLITSIDDDSIMKLDFSVPSVFLTNITPGMKIYARSRAMEGKIFEGRVIATSSRIDPLTRSFIVRAVIDNNNYRLRPGLLMNVTIKKDIRTAITIPQEAIIPVGEEKFVYVARQEGDKIIAQKRSINIGGRSGNMAEVISGLEEGELIVTHGAIKLRDGAHIIGVEEM